MVTHSRAGPDRGAVTVEAAIALSALTVFVGLVLAGFTAITGQLRCIDAAREAARLIARGQPELATQAVAEIAPPAARLSVTTTGDAITVEVRADPAGALLPGLHLRGSAFAVLEPGAPYAGP
ncbi:TadE family type IV pilus minor pilin [Amycolatopsis endophytica]|uniref:Flp pilus assembly protein TadG n=1 Tax=Amycolatopsis endophytica TaxID=860233 RepID=A0A853B2Y2_9PSEU|nr:TadE family type IV pilus minor pilin [Amycolatopsis endophytica]NYI88996.1 Flp pilus assembly protein TadG [Amycolatopsis endophytica]